MDREDARRVLGVSRAASSEQLRAAYRDRLRATHPDLHGGSSAATAAVVEAYRALVGLDPDDPDAGDIDVPDVAPSPAVPSTGVVVDGDTVAAELPAGDLFLMLIDVGEAIGDVVHVDPEGKLIEVIVQFEGYGPCSVLLTLQGRATGVTEAWCTVETLSGDPPPPTVQVAELLAVGLRAIVA